MPDAPAATPAADLSGPAPSGGAAPAGKTFTAKELKKVFRPRFQQEPETYYPKAVFEEFGYTRAVCPKCGSLYWRRTEARTTCGDSSCEGRYSFIGDEALRLSPPADASERSRELNNVPKGEWTIPKVWASFVESFTHTTPAHTVVGRYPVVARWRDDCEFTAAGIQCYQPFCVTGEVDPPANPLIQPQFCMRFNDLDSIGLSGRHYSGFTMLGIQVFNTPEKYVYWKDDIIRNNLTWLRSMGIDLDEVTLIADVWAGGGNLGACVEYFIRGLEVGNMVFMEFKAFPDGTLEKLPVQVIDVGIGLERIPWLLNGSVTSYLTAFPLALEEFCSLTSFDRSLLTGDAWKAFGTYSCLLNIDEVDDIDATWALIGQKTGFSAEEMKGCIEPVRDAYIFLDHLRTLMVAIQDGALPSNVGGGSNLRNVLRRAFHVSAERGWFQAMGGIDGMMRIIDAHRRDLEALHGQGSFPPFRPLRDVLDIEYQRWSTTDKDARAKLEKLAKKRGGKLQIEDWVTVVTTYGLDADQVSEIVGEPVPQDLYCKIAEQQERNQVKQAAAQLYDVVDLPPTDCLYYSQPRGEFLLSCEGSKVVKVFANKEDSGKRNLVVLDRTVLYPTSGGQQSDSGEMLIVFQDGSSRAIKIVEGRKVGPCVFHLLDGELSEAEEARISSVSVQVDEKVRSQLMCHHTAAHIIHAAAGRVLGPHVWQAGAKKTVEGATLDITHYRGLRFEEEREIEKEANRIVRACVPITKQSLDKAVAEKEYGFSLYQGGVVPGSSVRCVVIGGRGDEPATSGGDTTSECACSGARAAHSVLASPGLVDAEACCGTHLDNTGRVGLIRIVKSNRISDGVVRVYFLAGDRALDYTAEQTGILNSQMTLWGVEQDKILATGEKFFTGWKQLSNTTKTLTQSLLESRVEAARLQALAGAQGPSPRFVSFSVIDDAPTSYLTAVPELVKKHLLKDGALLCDLGFVGEGFLFCVSADAQKLEELHKFVQEACPRAAVKKMPMKLGAEKKKAAQGKKKADAASGAEPAAAPVEAPQQLMVTGLEPKHKAAVLSWMQAEK